MRAANFCDADKTLLVNILGGPTMCDDTKTYMSVVDCKEIDRSTMDKKNQAWSEVTHAFNANSYVQRSTEQLQSLWKKLKMRAKKCATSDMRQPPFDLLLNGKQHIAQQCHVLASRLCRLVCIGNLAALISAARWRVILAAYSYGIWPVVEVHPLKPALFEISHSRPFVSGRLLGRKRWRCLTRAFSK